MDYKKISSKEVFIFDVDGTLYSQPAMRLRMAMSLGGYYALHFWKMKELVSLYLFRKLREDEKYRTKTMDEQISAAAGKTGIGTERCRSVVDKWMFVRPLDIMCKCAFASALDFISVMQSSGKKIVIYSDYPAKEKLDVLGINADYIFTPQDEKIGELKPSKKAMNHIVSQLECSSDAVLYVGDRDEKDGKSARLAGIDYCDIKAFLAILEKKS